MDPKTIQFWNECRLQLLSFRANFDPSKDTATQVNALKANMESTARQIDPNRRTSPYNPPSLYESQFDAISSKITFLATQWVKDGSPNVPNV